MKEFARNNVKTNVGTRAEAVFCTSTQIEDDYAFSKVTIDAVASIFALLVLLISTVHMWKDHAFKRSDP